MKYLGLDLNHRYLAPNVLGTFWFYKRSRRYVVSLSLGVLAWLAGVRERTKPCDGAQGHTRYALSPKLNYPMCLIKSN